MCLPYYWRKKVVRCGETPLFDAICDLCIVSRLVTGEVLIGALPAE